MLLPKIRLETMLKFEEGQIETMRYLVDLSLVSVAALTENLLSRGGE